MASWYLVRFGKAGELYRFPSDLNDLADGDFFIARTHRGREMGCVVGRAKEPTGDGRVSEFMGRIEARANDSDMRREAENREKEKEAFAIATREIERFHLDMTLIRVQYLFDRSRIVFYFKAMGKVDFRDLVKALAGIFKTRIEMKQIGVRDEAKLLGGFGPCGRMTCCCTWLKDFASVVIRMAKTQNLSLNPQKISGLCGRLMCCLGYEQSLYEDAIRSVPRIGREVVWKGERGRISAVNVITECLTVEFENREIKPVKVPFAELSEMTIQGRPCRQAGKAGECSGCGRDAEDETGVSLSAGGADFPDGRAEYDPGFGGAVAATYVTGTGGMAEAAPRSLTTAPDDAETGAQAESTEA